MTAEGRRSGPLGLLRTSRMVSGALEAHPRPPSDGRTAVVGEDPLRVLVVGAGTAVGYGVTTRAEALDGRLAVALAAATGRGVIVETRIRPDLRLEDTVELLGAAGAHTFHAVVWSPTFLEVVRAAPLRRWRRFLDDILVHLRSTGTVDTGVLLLGLPAVHASTRLEAIAVHRLGLVTDRIAAVAARSKGVRFTAVEPVGRVEDLTRIWDGAYYARCADVVLPALLEVLPASAGVRL